MIKVQFGCGLNAMPGWQNYDQNVNITRKLPFPDGSVSRIFIEHCIEHVTAPQMLGFFREAFRILEHGGAIRVTYPDCMRILEKQDENYLQFLNKSNWRIPGTPDPYVGFAIIGTHHGHQQLLTSEVLIASLRASGFESAYKVELLKSDIPEFVNVENHWRIIGHPNNNIESVAVEARKA